MKSLKKALDLLELIMNSPGKAVTPSVAAEALGLDPATCVRIMSELTKQGYLEHISRREGYIPGPAAFTFADRPQWKYVRLARAAEEPVKELAISLRSVINISVLHDNFRYMLFHFSGDASKAIPLTTRNWCDFHTSGTGRLLLSTVPEETVDEINARFGIKDVFGSAVDMKKFKAELKEIASAGAVSFDNPAGNCRTVGALVRPEGYPPAAIGFGVPHARAAEALKAVIQTAKQIESAFFLGAAV
jgi:DNA-binding IclR family transcriptional regulator